MRCPISLILPLLFSVSANAQDYSEHSFDVSLYEKKMWESRSYLRLDVNSSLERESRSVFAELNSNNILRKDLLNLEIDLSAKHFTTTDASFTENLLVLNKFVQSFGDEEKSIEVGKSVKRWGKGYAYSAVAFFERDRNLFFPEFTREGFWLAEGRLVNAYTSEVFSSTSVAFLWAPEIQSNESLYENPKRRAAVKAYALIKETDIDIMAGENLLGFDFSTSLTSQLEFHGEWGKVIEGESYLAGIRYQSTTDFLLIAEVFKDYREQNFLYFKASQKEPFSILYLTAYAIYVHNIEGDFNRSLIGLNYNFYGRMDFDGGLQQTSTEKGIKILMTYHFQ